jgi:putative aldouronate transport system substrate-binding protein
MNWKRLQVGWVSLLVIALLVSACSSNNKDNVNNASPSSSASAAETPTEQPKISILSTSPAPYTQSVSDWSTNIYVNKLEELTGTDLDFEFLGWADYQTQLTVRFASGDLADMIRTPAIDFAAHANAVEQGAILELNELLEQYGPNIKANIPERVWKDPKVSKDGKIYAIPALVPTAQSQIVFVREDWLEKAGMETPVTPEDWLAYFEKVKTMDMNGDGDPNDEYGFYVRENMVGSDLFFYEFGAYPDHWVEQGDEYIPSVITPKMKDVLNFWRTLYKNGYINPNAFTNKAADWQAGIQNSKAGSWLHYVDNLADSWSQDKFVGQTDARPIMVEPPKGPNGQGVGLATTGIYYNWIIPSKTKNPENVIKFLDKAWSSEEVKKFNTFGLEGRNHEVVDGKIVWDAALPVNATNNESYAFQINTNVTGHSLNNAEVIKLSPIAEQLQRGFEISEKFKIVTDSTLMPVPEAFKTRPELLPNFKGGATLLLDMFAKVITSDVDIDAEFDKFVQEWRSRGGDEAIKQATEWHNKFKAN